MKKIYVNLPVLGRKEKDISASILKMKKIAETLLEDECEVINFNKTMSDGVVTNLRTLSEFAEDVKTLAKADYFVTTSTYDTYYENRYVEDDVVRGFNIPVIKIPELYLVCPDLKEVQERMRNDVHECKSYACN